MKSYDNFSEFVLSEKSLSKGRLFIPQAIAARELNVVPQTVINRIDAGIIDGFRLDGKLFVYADSLMSLLNRESEQVHICEAYIIKALEERRDHIPYSELMEKVALSWQNPQHRARIALILAIISTKSVRENKVLISCIVQRKGTKVIGPKFFDLAKSFVSKGLIKPYSNEDKFLKRQIKKSFKKYAKETS